MHNKRRVVTLVLTCALLVGGCTSNPRSPSTAALPVPPDPSTGGPTFANAPPDVNNRAPLFYCGAHIQFPPFEDLEHDPGSAGCFAERFEDGVPAEWIRVLMGFEGDPILQIVRVLDDGTIEQYTDSTRDRLGTRAWFLQTCTGFDTIVGDVVGCDVARQISPELSG